MAAGTTITFEVNQVTNYRTSEPSAVFKLETRTSGNYPIDSYQGTTMTVAATPSVFTNVNVTTESFVTGVENTYTFSFNFTVANILDQVLDNSILDITFPTEITISDPSYSANTCRVVVGTLRSISCEFIETQKLRATQLFSDNRLGDWQITIEMDDIKNPRSLLQSSSFQFDILDANGYSQKSLTTGKTITATTPSDFQSISVVPTSEANGAITTYTFSITLSNDLGVGEFIRVTFPTDEITPSVADSTCTGITTLATDLT